MGFASAGSAQASAGRQQIADTARTRSDVQVIDDGLRRSTGIWCWWNSFMVSILVVLILVWLYDDKRLPSPGSCRPEGPAVHPARAQPWKTPSTAPSHFGPKAQSFTELKGAALEDAIHRALSFRPEGPAVHPAKGAALVNLQSHTYRSSISMPCLIKFSADFPAGGNCLRVGRVADVDKTDLVVLAVAATGDRPRRRTGTSGCRRSADGATRCGHSRR